MMKVYYVCNTYTNLNLRTFGSVKHERKLVFVGIGYMLTKNNLINSITFWSIYRLLSIQSLLNTSRLTFYDSCC